MTYRYSATSIPGDLDNHNLRPGHSTGNTPFPTKCQPGDMVFGNEIWSDTGTGREHENNVSELWLHVESLERKTTLEKIPIDCWMAIYHKRLPISILTKTTNVVDENS